MKAKKGKKRLRQLAALSGSAALALGEAIITSPPAQAAVEPPCIAGSHGTIIDPWTRNDGYEHTVGSTKEGYNNYFYEPGLSGFEPGVCWYNDDNGFGPPDQMTAPSGCHADEQHHTPCDPGSAWVDWEGADCSGLVAKTWGIPNDYSTGNFVSWPYNDAWRPGPVSPRAPFYTGVFYNTAENATWKAVALTNLVAMDALVLHEPSPGTQHTFMYVSTNSDMSVLTYEARSRYTPSPWLGTGQFTRASIPTGFVGRQRKGWALK
jgi:hypothetical protein